MAERDPDIETLVAHLRARTRDPDDTAPDDTTLLAFAEGRLTPDEEAAVLAELERSPALRRDLVELRRPIDPAQLAWAVDALCGPAGVLVPDPFAPTSPGLVVEGPYGGLRAVMDTPRRDDAGDTRFPLDGRFDLIGHGEGLVAFVAAADGVIRVLGPAHASRRAAALRIRSPVAALFSTPGRWTAGFVVGVDAEAIEGRDLASARAATPTAVWRAVEVDVVDPSNPSDG